MYQVEKDLSLSEQSWRKVKIVSQGFTNKGALRYDVLDEKTERKIMRIYIMPWKKQIRAFQGSRALNFHYSDGIDGSAPHYLLTKILNFLMW